jgi:hypothetical protein
MEELKFIAEIVGGLSTTALHAFIAWLLYKLVWVVAAIYIMRLAIIKVHDWMIKGKIKTWDLDGISIDKNVAKDLKTQLLRLRTPTLQYLHSSDIFELRNALDKHFEEKGK